MCNITAEGHFSLYFVLLCFLSFFVENTHSKKLSNNESNTSFRLIIFNTLVSFVSGVVAK